MKENYRYLSIEELNNSLIISLTDEGKEKVNEDGLHYFNFCDYFEDIQCNSEFIFHEDLGDSGFGLTSAPGISDGYYLCDDNHNEYITSFDDSKLYYFNDYMVVDFCEVLNSNGQVTFQMV